MCLGHIEELNPGKATAEALALHQRAREEWNKLEEELRAKAEGEDDFKFEPNEHEYGPQGNFFTREEAEAFKAANPEYKDWTVESWMAPEPNGTRYSPGLQEPRLRLSHNIEAAQLDLALDGKGFLAPSIARQAKHTQHLSLIHI